MEPQTNKSGQHVVIKKFTHQKKKEDRNEKECKSKSLYLFEPGIVDFRLELRDAVCVKKWSPKKVWTGMMFGRCSVEYIKNWVLKRTNFEGKENTRLDKHILTE
jgi:hypothetical protein